MKLSIIIPVFNLESYIKKCMDSIYTQDVDESDYEIIFVNDGSTDSSEAIIKANIHANSRIISQKNSRQGAARNKGLSFAHGEYIWFVDGDDVIGNGALREIFEIIQKSPFDILFFKYLRIHHYGMELNQLNTPSIVHYNGIEYLAKRKLTLCPCYVYRRKFLIEHNISFLEQVVFEDCDFSTRTCFCATKVLEANFTPYFAFTREGKSTTQTNSIFHLESLKTVLTSMMDFAISKRKQHGFQDLCFYSAMVFNTLFSRYRQLSYSQRHAICFSNKFKSNVIFCMFNSKFNKYVLESIFLFLAFNIIFRIRR